MNKNIIRLAAGFLILLGLAYLGNRIFIPKTSDAAAAAVPASAPAAAAPAGASAGAVPAGASAAAGGASGYAVYPDRATENALGLEYPTFNGDFAQAVTVTPLPPHFPGTTIMRVLPGHAQSLDISLGDPRCAGPVHVALYRINDKQAVGSAALDATALKMSIPFSDGNIPAMLLEIRMDEKAQNNYWCGVTVHWNRKHTPAA